MLSALSFCVGGAIGFASGFVLGVDYGRRHSEPWRDLRNTAVDFADWVKQLRAAKAPATAPDSGSASKV
jgi:hypothetical protein